MKLWCRHRARRSSTYALVGKTEDTAVLLLLMDKGHHRPRQMRVRCCSQASRSKYSFGGPDGSLLYISALVNTPSFRLFILCVYGWDGVLSAVLINTLYYYSVASFLQASWNMSWQRGFQDGNSVLRERVSVDVEEMKDIIKGPVVTLDSHTYISIHGGGHV